MRWKPSAPHTANTGRANGFNNLTFATGSAQIDNETATEIDNDTAEALATANAVDAGDAAGGVGLR